MGDRPGASVRPAPTTRFIDIERAMTIAKTTLLLQALLLKALLLKAPPTSVAGLLALWFVAACSSTISRTSEGAVTATISSTDAASRNAKYTTVKLAPDLSTLTENERKM